MSQITEITSFDQLSLERAVHGLSKTLVRSPLTVERIKLWVKQFKSPEEKTLAWLILQNLIFRTNDQLLSSMRQAMKHTAVHFVDQLGLDNAVAWKDALRGAAGLKFYCGPPSLPALGFTSPGKSGELLARMMNQHYRVQKQYPSDVVTLQPDERFIIVDDGTYTGVQLVDFLRAWDIDYSSGRVAIAVGIAHATALEHLSREFPDVTVFHGELLSTDLCFEGLCRKWVETGQWVYEMNPLDVYDTVHTRNQPYDSGNGGNGYGNIGALVAFGHGVPDDSIQLLWDPSPTWTPLVDR